MCVGPALVVVFGGWAWCHDDSQVTMAYHTMTNPHHMYFNKVAQTDLTEEQKTNVWRTLAQLQHTPVPTGPYPLKIQDDKGDDKWVLAHFSQKNKPMVKWDGPGNETIGIHFPDRVTSRDDPEGKWVRLSLWDTKYSLPAILRPQAGGKAGQSARKTGVVR